MRYWGDCSSLRDTVKCFSNVPFMASRRLSIVSAAEPITSTRRVLRTASSTTTVLALAMPALCESPVRISDNNRTHRSAGRKSLQTKKPKCAKNSAAGTRIYPPSEILLTKIYEGSVAGEVLFFERSAVEKNP